MKISEVKITDIIQDDKNLNKGTADGKAMITKSLQKFGAGRSILLDKNNRIIAGNKTHENAEEIGMEDVIVVESDGTKLVAVKRTDIDLDSKEGREMALADNATVKVDLSWDDDAMREVSETWGIDTEEWGVFQATEINPDDFFNSIGNGDGNDKGEKIIVTVPVDKTDAIDEIRTVIADAVRFYSGVVVK